MSGQQMITALKQLGYPKANSLDSQGLDWMFENDSMLPFLEWFCNSISPANMISKEEMKEYQALESSEEGILEGAQLEEALKNLKVTQNQQVTAEQLVIDIDQLSDDLERCKKQKQDLIQKRNKLSVHHTSLSHRQSKLRQVENKVKMRYKKCIDQNQSDNVKLDSSLDSLMETVGELSEIYELPVQKPAEDVSPMFMSQISLDEYCEKEDKFSKELSAFTKKKFFEGIADVAGQTEGSRYEILEINNPDMLLVRGVGQDVNVSQCKELARIQRSFPKAKLKHVESKVSSVQLERRVQTAEDILKQIQDGQFVRDISSINNHLSEVDTALQIVQKDLESLTHQEIPELIQESTSSQVSHILTGDYNLKLVRQDYFLSNQDQVIQPLVQQRARNEFLTMAFELENRNHREIHRLLIAVKQHLQKHLKNWQNRMKMMEDPLLTSAKYKRSTIDSRDTFSKRLHQMLDVGKGDHLFLTYSSLEDGAERLNHSHAAACNSAEMTLNSKEELLQILEQNVVNCEEMIYAGSSTTCGQPSLTPPQFLTTITQLEEMIKRLEHAIKDTVRDVEHKKQSLKNDPLLYKERKLFVYFFTNPSCLKQLFDEMSSRLQAQKLQ